MTDPLARPAFRVQQLDLAVKAARFVLLQAQRNHANARGKAARLESSRAKRVAATALADAEKAVAHEIKAEKLVPAVQRDEIVQRDMLTWERNEAGEKVRVRKDVTLRDARVEVIAGRRAELRGALERLRAREAIPAKLYEAARRYRTAWEMANRDAYPAGFSAGVGGTPQSGNRRIEDAVGNGLELAAARHAIGRFGTGLLDHVVVHDLSLASWAERQGESEHVVKGSFVMVLKRLAEHWETSAAVLVAVPEGQIRSAEFG